MIRYINCMPVSIKFIFGWEKECLHICMYTYFVRLYATPTAWFGHWKRLGKRRIHSLGALNSTHPIDHVLVHPFHVHRKILVRTRLTAGAGYTSRRFLENWSLPCELSLTPPHNQIYFRFWYAFSLFLFHPVNPFNFCELCRAGSLRKRRNFFTRSQDQFYSRKRFWFLERFLRILSFWKFTE